MRDSSGISEHPGAQINNFLKQQSFFEYSLNEKGTGYEDVANPFFCPSKYVCKEKNSFILLHFVKNAQNFFILFKKGSIIIQARFSRLHSRGSKTLHYAQSRTFSRVLWICHPYGLSRPVF